MLHQPGANVATYRTSSRLLTGLVWAGPLAILAMVASSCLRFDPPSMTHVLQDQAQRYPQMQVQDWYKLLHQSAMGSAHLGADSSAIYNYLLHEWAGLGPSRGEDLLEYISPDSSMVRLNLRPYKEAGGNPPDVYAMMTASWEIYKPSVKRLEDCLAQLTFMAERGDIWLNPDDFAAYLEEQRARDYPAVHHSDRYEQAYRPAYRVVLRSTLRLPEPAHQDTALSARTPESELK